MFSNPFKNTHFCGFFSHFTKKYSAFRPKINHMISSVKEQIRTYESVEIYINSELILILKYDDYRNFSFKYWSLPLPNNFSTYTHFYFNPVIIIYV